MCSSDLLASRRWAVPNLEHFDFGDPDIRSLTFQARHMDRLLLSPLQREDFLAEARYLQTALRSEERRVGKECRSRWWP